MTDSEIFREFMHRQRNWMQTLQELRSVHVSTMGKRVGEVHWLASPENGPLSWFGYFWEPEKFWFGFGWNDGVWRPLIEADLRSRHSAVWDNLRDQMGGGWETISVAGGIYCRLWSRLDSAETAAGQLQWFKERSHEIHEYLVL